MNKGNKVHMQDFGIEKQEKDRYIYAIQKYLPSILNDRTLLHLLSEHIEEKKSAKIDIEHLRYKLKKYLDASFRKDDICLAYRLIYQENKKGWIWLSGKEIFAMTHRVCVSHKT